jgi:FlaA1/EpsC-like NDP-sugar epimerase
MKTVLITGAAGSIGSQLTRKLSMKYKVIALDQDETRLFELDGEVPGIIPYLADIRSSDAMVALFKHFRPEIVIHAAALKHVGMCEKYPQEAYKTNVGGTDNLVHCAYKFGTKKFLLVSTDKSVRSTTVMGNTKREAEEITMAFNRYRKTRYYVVRFGNVLASRGSVIPIFNKQIEKGLPITVTDDRMERYFMTIYEACDLMEKALTLKSGIYMFDMGKPMKIVDLAKTMIRLSGKDIPIEFIGRKDAEKIFEELYDKRMEKVEKTKYNKILKVIKK